MAMRMRRNPGVTEALLSKVNSQLRGERVEQPKTEQDDLNAYISNLTQKTSKQHHKSVDFEDAVGISITSSEETAPANATANAPVSKFLKKKTPESIPFEKQPNYETGRKSGGDKGQAGSQRSYADSGRTQTSYNSGGRGKSQTSKALYKAAKVTKKITEKPLQNLYNFDTESDDTSSLKRPGGARGGYDKDTSQSDTLGKDGGRFLKKKVSSPQEEMPEEAKKPKPAMKVTIQEKKPKVKDGSPFRSSVRTPTNVVLSSDEESLGEFVQALSDSEDKPTARPAKATATKKSRSPEGKPPVTRRSPSPKTPRKSPSPRFAARRTPSPQFLRTPSPGDNSSAIDSFASEIIGSVHLVDSDNESSDEEDIKLNIVDIDSLEPLAMFGGDDEPLRKTTPLSSPRAAQSSAKKKTTEYKAPKPKSSALAMSELTAMDKPLFSNATHKASSKSALRYDTVNEQMTPIVAKTVLADSDYREYSIPENVQNFSDISEVVTEQSGAASKMMKSLKNIDSLSEAMTVIKTRDSSTPIENSVAEASITERIGMPSEISDRRHPETPSEHNEYSESFSEATESERSRSDKTLSDGYRSDDSTWSETPPPVKKQHENHAMRTVEVQTEAVQTADPGGLFYQWNPLYTGVAIPEPRYGLGFVNPAPIASHVVSADALEAMTSYSPCMLALHDLLKQQLEMTREFVESQRRLHAAYTYSEPDNGGHKYTTLEDTKEYIRKHRKPKLTFKQALKMVKAEESR